VVRTTLGAEVDTTVTVSGSESVEYIRADSTDTLAADGSESIVVRPPTGFVFELLAYRFEVDAPSSSGSDVHAMILKSESRTIDLLQANSTDTDDIVYKANHIVTGTTKQSPPTATAQALATRGARADSGNGFLIQYFNTSTATQTDSRTIRLWVREIAVSE